MNKNDCRHNFDYIFIKNTLCISDENMIQMHQIHILHCEDIHSYLRQRALSNHIQKVHNMKCKDTQ